jgi:hypothetical protein
MARRKPRMEAMRMYIVNKNEAYAAILWTCP